MSSLSSFYFCIIPPHQHCIFFFNLHFIHLLTHLFFYLTVKWFIRHSSCDLSAIFISPSSFLLRRGLFCYSLWFSVYIFPSFLLYVETCYTPSFSVYSFHSFLLYVETCFPILSHSLFTRFFLPFYKSWLVLHSISLFKYSLLPFYTLWLFNFSLSFSVLNSHFILSRWFTFLSNFYSSSFISWSTYNSSLYFFVSPFFLFSFYIFLIFRNCSRFCFSVLSFVIF